MEKAITPSGPQTSTPSPSSQEKAPRKPRYRYVDIQDEVENFEDYEPGGLCPMNIGDDLHDGRFRVFHKLGHGGIATVWLCRDRVAGAWRAVKVNAADHSSEDGPDLRAARALETSGDDDAPRVAVPLETFWADSPNGRHLCSVLPVLGPRLCDWRVEMGRDAARANRLCAQLVEGLGSLHARGVCHGDLRPQNVLMRLRPGCLDGVDEEAMRELLGPPDPEEVRTVGGEESENAPREVVAALPWQAFGGFVTDDIAIVDFGESFPAASPPAAPLGIPRKYAAPEVAFGGVPGPASDIWSLALSLIETRLGAALDEDLPSVLWRMERFAGPVPPPYRAAATEMLRKARGEPAPAADAQGESAGEELGPVTAPLAGFAKTEKRQAAATGYDDPLEILLGAEYTATEYVEDEDDPDGGLRPEMVFVALERGEVAALAGLLRKMLRHEPRERAGADEIRRDGWFIDKPARAQGPAPVAEKETLETAGEGEKTSLEAEEEKETSLEAEEKEESHKGTEEKNEAEKKGESSRGRFFTWFLGPALAALLLWGIATVAFKGPRVVNSAGGGVWGPVETQVYMIEMI